MTALSDIAEHSALSLGRALAEGSIDAVELAKHFLERIEAQTSPVFIRVTGERALREAEAAAKRLQAGRPLSALDGVPIAWKDLVDMQGEITTAGSDLYRHADPAVRDAPILANVCSAGMVSLGKVNLTEFAYSGIGLNPHFGTPVNPHDATTPRAPGGSSSGSAVAVASGLSPCAIGTDTGGSVRIPAAFNGLVGYKSSEKRIDSSDVFALSPTLDTMGPLARDVADCIALDAVLRGENSWDVKPVPLSTMRFFVAENVVLEGLEPAVASNFLKSVEALQAAGASVTRGAVPQLDRAVQLVSEIGTITAAEAYAEHQHLIESEAVSRIDRRVVARIMIGQSIGEQALNTLHRERAAAIQEINSFLDGAFLLMPTAPHVAPEIAPLEADDDVFHRINLKTLRNTSLGNFLNLPGLALPNGTDDNGMPTSLLVSATAGDDDRLLAAGLEIEKAVRAAA